MTIPDVFGEPWVHALTFVVVTSMATAATLDVVQRKRDVRAQIGWVGLVWLSPLVGPILYYLLGINRVSRRVARLEYGAGWQRAADLSLDSSEQETVARLSAQHEGLASMVRAMAKLTGRSIYPGNAIEILHNGDEAYPRMLEAIRSATSNVNFCSYIFDFDDVGQSFSSELLAAQERGVEVRILIDAVGARYGKPNAIYELRKRGLRVEAFLPSTLGRGHYANLRNHRKILVVDGRVAFTGGTNIRRDHYLALKPVFPVRCLHFRFEGPVVRHLQEVFAVDWAFVCGEDLQRDEFFPSLSRVGESWARGISDGPDADLDQLNAAIFLAINSARETITIVTPYFLPENILVFALSAAVLRGVEVKVVIPENNNIKMVQWASLALLPHLMQRGVQFSLSPAPFDHTKLMVVDKLWSLVGSTNWDPRSLRLNFEFNVECYDPVLGQKLADIAESRFSEGKRWTLEDHDALPLWQKLRGDIVKLASPYL